MAWHLPCPRCDPRILQCVPRPETETLSMHHGEHVGKRSITSPVLSSIACECDCSLTHHRDHSTVQAQRVQGSHALRAASTSKSTRRAIASPPSTTSPARSSSTARCASGARHLLRPPRSALRGCCGRVTGSNSAIANSWCGRGSRRRWSPLLLRARGQVRTLLAWMSSGCKHDMLAVTGTGSAMSCGRVV